jgi:hypothetical protein
MVHVADTVGSRLERIRALVAHFIHAPIDSVESQYVVSRIFKEIDLAREEIHTLESLNQQPSAEPK